MFCPKCGTQCPDTARFCKQCRNMLNPQQKPISDPPVSTKQVKTKKPKKSKKPMGGLIAGCILLIAAAAGGYGFYRYWTAPSQMIIRQIGDGDYKRAARTYNRTDEDELSNGLDDKIKQEIDEIYNAFRDKKKSYQNTIDALDKMNDFDSKEIQSYIEEIRNKVEALNSSGTAYESGLKYLEEGDYKNAILQLRQVSKDDANYEDAQKKCDEAAEQYRTQIREMAKENADKGNLRGAVSTVESGLNVLENDSELEQLRDQYKSQLAASEKEDVLHEAEAAAGNGDYKTAVLKLQSAHRDNPDDADLAAKLSEYETAYASQVLEQADACIAQNDYDQAINILTEGNQVLPENTQIKEKLDQTEQNRPVEVCSLKMQNDRYFEIGNSSYEDVQGNLYTGENILIKNKQYDSQATIEFYCGASYSKLTFLLAPETNFEEDNAITIEVLSDGNSRWAQKITQKSEPQLVTVDITGCNWLQFRASEVAGTYHVDTPCIISNPVVQ